MRVERAHRLYNYARNRKKIIPLPCFVCGSLEVHGHHPDYDQPLQVVWLCPEHHNQLHADARRAPGSMPSPPAPPDPRRRYGLASRDPAGVDAPAPRSAHQSDEDDWPASRRMKRIGG